MILLKILFIVIGSFLLVVGYVSKSAKDIKLSFIRAEEDFSYQPEIVMMSIGGALILITYFI